MTTDEPAATWQAQLAAAGTHVADGQQFALALAPLVEASVNAAVAPLHAELTEVRALLSARDQELGSVRLERDQLAEQLRTLQTPPEPDPSPDALAHDSDGLPAETAQQPAERQRPWWRFW